MIKNWLPAELGIMLRAMESTPRVCESVLAVKPFAAQIVLAQQGKNGQTEGYKDRQTPQDPACRLAITLS